MKVILVGAALAGALLSTAAFSQATNLGGPSMGIDFNLSHASSKFRVGNNTFNPDDQSGDVGVRAAYGFALGDKFLLGVGATYGLGDMKAGTTSVGGVSYELTGKEQYSLYVEPGFPLSASTLAYGKVFYQNTKWETQPSLGAKMSDNFDGTGYGLGLRSMLTSNAYVQVELSQIEYSERSFNGLASKPSATVGSLGVGYKF